MDEDFQGFFMLFQDSLRFFQILSIIGYFWLSNLNKIYNPLNSLILQLGFLDAVSRFFRILGIIGYISIYPPSPDVKFRFSN